jgi:GWxTD domain-containing protein
MRKLCIACALFLASIVVFAAKTPHEPAVSEGNGPLFRCQVGQRLGTESDSLHLIVAASVPYDNLTFLRTDTGFVASFELVTSIFRSGDGLYKEQIENITVAAVTYAETNSRTRNALRADEFLVAPGDYDVRVTLKDIESRKKTKWEGKVSLTVPDSLLQLSDIYWISEDSSLAEWNVPRVIGNFPSTEIEARARVQICSHAPNEIQLSWAVVSQKRDTLQAELDTVKPSGAIQTFEYTIKLEGLSAQQYQLIVEAVGNGRREVKRRDFGVYVPGIPSSVTNLDQAIKQMRYVATSEENSRFRQALPQEKETLFKEFWKRRDPTEGTEQNELMEEYFTRVEYSNEKFATHREGWDTDRGRIYILYGEPTDIERHPFDSDKRPYEIWFYASTSRRFVFVDYTGFGDYNLVGPQWGY